MEEEEKIEERKKKVSKWFHQKENLLLVSVLIFAFVIRVYYFVVAANQPLWWDELCYGSLAKNYVLGQWSGTSIIVGETLIRPPLFPILWSFLMRIGFSQLASKFFLELIPSILSVFFVYLVGKETFGKRTGIIAAFIFSTLWIHLFYTGRFLTNIPAMALLFPSFYLFMRALRKEKLDYKLFFWSLLLLSLSTLMRYPNGIFFFIFLLAIILTKKLNLNKIKFWFSGVLGVSPLLILFAINYSKYQNILPAFFGGDYINSSEAIAKPIAFNLLNFIPIYLNATFFVFFLIGILFLISNYFLRYDQLLKNRKEVNSLVLFSSLIFLYCFFIFYMKAAEDRWLFPSSLFISIFSAHGFEKARKFLGRYSKLLSLVIILVLLFFGAYSQILQANNLIEIKKDSYLQMEEGFLWAKENLPKNSTIVGLGIEPYAIYYADRNYVQLPPNLTDFKKMGGGDYLLLHAFTPQPGYINQYVQEHQDSLELVNAWFFDKEKKQPAVVIYENEK